MERIFHTWDKWECYPAGFYENKPPKGMTNEQAEEKYRELLADSDLFADVLSKIIEEWPHSCEHYLTNENMNRIAWMGQAALAYEYNIPARFRGGYNKLDDNQKKKADDVALEYINKWMIKNGYEELTHETIKSRTQANIY